MKNRVELRNYIRFQLSQLGAANGAHAFEQLCFELARERHVPNLLPATGPVQSGGDQGRDFESYRTYLAASPISKSSFAARASQDLVVGACTLERNNLPAKIRRDLKSMFGSGEKPDRVLYFCQADLPVAQRHKLQTYCRENHDASLDIHDGQAIADQLSDADTFWIAGQYLSIPADFYPAERRDEDYAKLRSRWLDANAEAPVDYADFLDIKRGLRTATHEASVRQDLEQWIAKARGFEADAPSRQLRQKARYEIAVAELRGRGNLDPAAALVDAFFEALPTAEPRAVDLLDAAVLSVYAWGAVLHRQTTITLDRIEEWGGRVAQLIASAEKTSHRRGERCSLLEAKAMLAALTSINDGRDVATGNILAAWSEVLKLIKETPHYPISHIAELVDLAAPFLAGQQGFKSLRDQVEELVEARSGQHAVAARSYRRALSQFEAGRHLDAIDELQKAKRGWFSGEEMTKSVMAMLLLAECYAALNLQIAARYYAAGAAYIAVNSDDESVRALTPLASMLLANSFFDAGEGFSFLKAFGSSLKIYGVLTPNAEGPARNEVDNGLAKTAVFVHLVRRLAPDLATKVDDLLKEWPVSKDELETHIAIVGKKGSPWAIDDIEAFQAKVASEFIVSPFADLGEMRSTRWAALGIQWEITSSADAAARAAALSLAAILQILQVELAEAELLIIPTMATLAISLGNVARPQVRELRGESRGWEILMPQEQKPGEDGLPDAIIVAATVLGEASAMSAHQFKVAFEAAFERGLNYRAHSVRPAREMMEFAHEQLGDEPARLRSSPSRSLSGDFSPPEPVELAWPTKPGPGYSTAKASKILANRYKRPFEIAGPTLRRILADERIRRVLLDVRNEGYRDWQILGALLSMVLQHQAEVGLSNPRDIRALSDAFRERSNRAEQPDDPIFDIETITPESLQGALFSSAAACMTTWGLQLNSRSIDPEGIRRLLDVRYGQATDDIPHDDILAT